MTKQQTFDSQVLTALADSTLSDKGLAHTLTGDTMSETRQLVFDALQRLMTGGLVRSYESGGVVWYEATEAPLLPKKTPKLDAGYADEDPGDGAPDRRYGS